MSLSYSAIIGSGSGKTTLPSVESWSTNNSILRDPPKSIMTRKIDKVSDTSSITQFAEESGDRVSEMISVYARGVNPMVSVSYGNEGNTFTTGNLVGSQNKQAYLPYRIMKDGQFTPPPAYAITPQLLLPLSRKPHESVLNVFAQPSSVDFSKKLIEGSDNYRTIKNAMNVSVRPTATINLGKEIVEPFEIKYIIKNPVKFDSRAGVSGIKTQYITNQEISELNKKFTKNIIHLDSYAGFSGLRTQDITSQEVLHPSKQIYENPLIVENIYPNQGTKENIKYTDLSHLDTNPYIQNTLHSDVKSKMSASIQVTPLEDMFDVDIKTKNPINISYTPLKTGYNKEDHIYNDFQLENRVLHTEAKTNINNPNIFVRQEIEYQQEQKRNIPNHNITTNQGTLSTQKNLDLTRDHQLKHTISAGGYEGRGNIPTSNRQDMVTNLNDSTLSEKSRRDRLIMDMKQERYSYK
jgi:hypothetical protein